MSTFSLQHLKSLGAATVYAFCTHGVFPKQAWKKFIGGPFKTVWVTDSCPMVSESIKGIEPFEVLSLAPLIADLLETVISNPVLLRTLQLPQMPVPFPVLISSAPRHLLCPSRFSARRFPRKTPCQIRKVLDACQGCSEPGAFWRAGVLAFWRSGVLACWRATGFGMQARCGVCPCCDGDKDDSGLIAVGI